MQILEELLYTNEHEWLKVEGDVATVGITEFAAKQLGDVVFVELPEMGDVLTQMKNFGVVESVKTVSDLFAPVSGEVVGRNPALLQEIDGEDNKDFHPEYVNEDPYGKGWMIRIRMSNKSEMGKLLSPAQYKEIAKE
jgi:glycine cleavage system H protein